MLARNGIKSRIANEKLILTKIKNGLSVFLPKYYIIPDKNDELKDDLLMDFINYPTLGEYIKMHKETISIQSKLFLIYIIAQALRSLKSY
jgi:hypothetical protein